MIMADLQVGIGDPTKPSLTAEEEKRVDADHKPIVDGLVWSAASTDIFLTIFGTRMDSGFVGISRPAAMDSLIMENGLRLVLTTTYGKPTFSVEGWGASLELPVDLARDPLKMQYVMEWLIDTTQEVLVCSKLGIPDKRVHDFALWLHAAANKVIGATGL
jgi:hypothetical protein